MSTPPTENGSNNLRPPSSPIMIRGHGLFGNSTEVGGFRVNPMGELSIPTSTSGDAFRVLSDDSAAVLLGSELFQMMNSIAPSLIDESGSLSLESGEIPTTLASIPEITALPGYYDLNRVVTGAELNLDPADLADPAAPAVALGAVRESTPTVPLGRRRNVRHALTASRTHFENFVNNVMEERLDNEIMRQVLEESFVADQEQRLMEQSKPLDIQSVTFQECSMESCRICMDDFEESTKIAILPCSHYFCDKCIREWGKRKPNCPYCEKEIPVVEEKDSASQNPRKKQKSS